jgi:hypothetical protein
MFHLYLNTNENLKKIIEADYKKRINVNNKTMVKKKTRNKKEK